MRSLRAVAFAALIFSTATACAQRPASSSTTATAVAQTGASAAAKTRWVDSVYRALSQDERIGQLFMVAAYSGGKNYNEELVTSLVEKGQVGGLIFMQGGPARQAVQTNKYQRITKVPLLLAMDAEWGLGMRLDSVPNFPRQMMLGATADTALSYQLGAAIAAQCNRLGVHINFAPVVDVNNNPANPVINARSFGEDKRNVARMGIAYARGMQDRGVMACAKHFPGHGDTDVDSHKDLPTIKKSLPQLDTLELYPFKELFKAGVQSVMIAHLEIPALETEPRVPTTLSKNTVTTLLREKLGFDGLVFTDALNMQGVAKYFPGGEADVRAFIAGADVLLFSENVPVGIAKIKSAMQTGRVSEAELERRVKKILAAKWDKGLAVRPQPISTANIVADLNRTTLSLRRSITEAAVTFARGEDGRAVRAIRAGGRTLYVGVNAGGSVIPSILKPSATRWVQKGGAGAAGILAEMKNYDAVVVGVHNLAIYPAGNYGLDASQLSFLKSAAAKDNAVVVVLGNAYAAAPFCSAPAVVVTYEGDTVAERTAAQVLMGQKRARGVLPVTPCAGLKPKPAAGSGNMGTGAVMPSRQSAAASANGTFQSYTPQPDGAQQASTPVQLTFDRAAFPSLQMTSAVGAGVVDSSKLYLLDAYLRNCVSQGVFPGCRVLAAKDGKVFYDRSIGRQTYDPSSPVVERTTLYDVASLTKVLATNLAVMKLWEEGKISLEKTVGDYLKWTRGTDKANIRIRDLLLHQAGLVAFIPFWKATMDTLAQPAEAYYRPASQKGFRVEVAQNLFLRNDYPDTVWERILQSPLETPGKYVYSDNDFYFLWGIVEKAAGRPMDDYLQEKFYGPLGLKGTAFGPLKGARAAATAPTENDQSFRKRTLQGYVHDQGAAMMGGVAGHAGLFSTAGDVATIFQMLMNGGIYGGKRYFKKETVEKWTAYNTSNSRRGLGWDKPNAGADAGSTSDRCSGYTFGHQGFTGTCAWADPATGIVFVFLSNRVHPNADNGAINRLGVRTVAQDRIYEAFGVGVDKGRGELRGVQVAGRMNAASSVARAAE